ncbi:MAG: hypothetical protein EZS28_005803, partial [Streblomastix strix]
MNNNASSGLAVLTYQPRSISKIQAKLNTSLSQFCQNFPQLESESQTDTNFDSQSQGDYDSNNNSQSQNQNPLNASQLLLIAR